MQHKQSIHGIVFEGSSWFQSTIIFQHMMQRTILSEISLLAEERSKKEKPPLGCRQLMSAGCYFRLKVAVKSSTRMSPPSTLRADESAMFLLPPPNSASEPLASPPSRTRSILLQEVWRTAPHHWNADVGAAVLLLPVEWPKVLFQAGLCSPHSSLFFSKQQMKATRHPEVSFVKIRKKLSLVVKI